MGDPDPAKICTSHVERQDLTIRRQMRLTRLTNGFSKKWENLWAAYCLHFTYNFCRIHKTLRVTPAMEAGITDRVQELSDLKSVSIFGEAHRTFMGGLGAPEWIVILLVGVVVIWLPWSRIFSKAGYSPWLSLAMFVPLVNVVVLFWFAFSTWPITERRG